MENENKNGLEEEWNEKKNGLEEVDENSQSVENAIETQVLPENMSSVETAAPEALFSELLTENDGTEEAEDEEFLSEDGPAREDFYAPMDGDGSMPDGMEYTDNESTAIYQKPKKSSMAIFAVLSTIIVALLIVIAVLLVANKPDFFNFNGFKEVSVGSVNGENVTEGQLRVFLAQEESTLLRQGLREQFGDSWQTMDQAAVMEAVDNFDWNKQNAEGVTFEQAAKNTAFDQAVLVHAKAAKAEEMGIGMTDEEKQQMASGISQMKSQYPTEEEFIKILNENYFKDEQTYLDFFITYQTAMNFDSEYQKDPSKFITDEAALTAYINDDTVTAKHILIKTVDDSNQPLPEDQIAAARAKAEEALSRAKAGEDFDALIDEYNQDPGQMQNKAGYAFGKGEMMPEFEAAAFALGVNEISELVEVSYGYHIIKRIVGLSELEQQMIQEAKVKKKQGALNKLKLYSELEKEAQAEAKAAASAASSASPSN